MSVLPASEMRSFDSMLQSLKSEIEGFFMPLDDNDLALFKVILNQPEKYWGEMSKLHSDHQKHEFIKSILDLLEEIFYDFDDNRDPTMPNLDNASKYAYRLMVDITEAERKA